MKSELQSLCCLPLNAAILVYLYDTLKEDLPTTRTGLFHPLVSNCLIHHIHTRKMKPIMRIKDFSRDLPPDIRSLLLKISKIAYTVLVESNTIIDQTFLESEKLEATENNMLGLLQIKRQTITMHGPDSRRYSFLHLSLQEFLAAFYISQLDQETQGKMIQIIFDQNPLSPVLPFYSGLTNMRAEQAQDILFRVLREPFDEQSVITKLCLDSKCDIRRHFLALLNCLYETNCKDVWSKVRIQEDTETLKSSQHGVTAFKQISKYMANTCDCPDHHYTLPFMHMVLYPTDLLAIGKFARVLCENVSKDSLIYIDLSFCAIRETEYKALAIELQREVELSKVFLKVHCTVQNWKCFASIKKMVQGRTSIVGLMTGFIKFTDEGHKRLALKYTIEGLSKDSACESLSFSGWLLNSSHILHLVLLLMRTEISTLKLMGNDLRKGMDLLSEALKYSNISILDLDQCNIDDSGLLLLGQTLRSPSNTIIYLDIEHNKYTTKGLSKFLNCLNDTNLTTLGVKLETGEHYTIVSSINNIRSLKNLPKLDAKVINERDFLSQRSLQAFHLSQFMLANPNLSSRTPHHN